MYKNARFTLSPSVLIHLTAAISSDASFITRIPTMIPTIAIRGHNGNVGRHIFPHLVKAHDAGQIKLVVLLRAESIIPDLPRGAEHRVIDPESEEGKAKLPSQLSGIHALM